MKNNYFFSVIMEKKYSNINKKYLQQILRKRINHTQNKSNISDSVKPHEDIIEETPQKINSSVLKQLIQPLCTYPPLCTNFPVEPVIKQSIIDVEKSHTLSEELTNWAVSSHIFQNSFNALIHLLKEKWNATKGHC